MYLRVAAEPGTLATELKLISVFLACKELFQIVFFIFFR